MIETGKYYVAFAQSVAYGVWKGVDVTFHSFKVDRIENGLCFVTDEQGKPIIYPILYTEERFGLTKEEAVKKAIKDLKKSIEHKQDLIDTLEAWKDN